MAITGFKFKNYISYAIGEIILVVIGILIAITINNWNENRKEKNLLKTYLQTYKNDLETDTLVVGRAIKLLEYSRPTYNKFLQPGISKEDYIKSPEGIGLMLTHNPFELKSKGINLLRNYIDNKNLGRKDTLVEDIIANHASFLKVLNLTQDRISNDISDQMQYLKNNQPWIADLLLGKLNNPKMLDYYISDTHRARLAVHNTLVNGNLLPLLNQYQSKMKNTLVLLEKRLKED